MPHLTVEETIAALRRAEDQEGHDLVEDSPGPPSQVQRWTCKRCGNAILRASGNVYGSALDASCVQDAEVQS